MIENVRDDLSERAGTAAGELGDLLWILRTAALAAVAGAIYTELRKEPGTRTWHGKVLGFVPYDFRVPSLNQLRLAYWNTRSTRVFTDRPVGVGWAVNIPALWKRLPKP